MAPCGPPGSATVLYLVYCVFWFVLTIWQGHTYSDQPMRHLTSPRQLLQYIPTQTRWHPCQVVAKLLKGNEMQMWNAEEWPMKINLGSQSDLRPVHISRGSFSLYTFACWVALIKGRVWRLSPLWPAPYRAVHCWTSKMGMLNVPSTCQGGYEDRISIDWNWTLISIG